MTYEKWIEVLKTLAQDEWGYTPDRMEFWKKGFTSDNPEVQTFIQKSNERLTGKDSNTLLNDLLILRPREKGSLSACDSIAVDQLYEDVKANGMDAAIDKLHRIKKAFSIADISDYEAMKEQFILRPLNYQLHIRELKGCVYQRVGDFALVLYQFLGDTDKTLSSRKVMRSELAKWGMEEEVGQVMQNALENSARLFPACAYNKNTDKEVDLLKDDFIREDITLYGNHFLISTFRTVNGALALFYPGVVDKLMELMGGEFIAVFMNINDIMIFDRHDASSKRYARTSSQSDEMGEMLSKRRYLCNEEGIFAM